MRHIFFLFSILIVFNACKDKQVLDDTDITYGYEYFPLQIGNEWIYRVDSITYDPAQSGGTISANQNTVYVKEVVVDTFFDELGRLSHRIERFEKPFLDTTWALRDVWSALRDARVAERFEENVRLVKMGFPLRFGDLFDPAVHLAEDATFPVAGEQIEIFKAWEAEVLAVDEPATIGDFSFEKVTTIQLADEENLLEKRYGLEKYAKDIGLIYKELEIYDTQRIDMENAPWEEKAEKGFKVVVTLLDYNL